MKKYILGICSVLLIAIAACANPVVTGPWQKPTKKDSLLNLKYRPAAWETVVDELSKLAKYQSMQIDSAIRYINALPYSWDMAFYYQQKMTFLTYRQLNDYANIVEQDFMLYNKINSKFPGTIDSEDYFDRPMKKPVIYLYPEKEQKIDVTLGFTGTGLYTWPQIDSKQNWSVTAQPDGMLKDSKGEEYPYLFWEGTANDYSWINRNEGFVVAANETEIFLRDKLKLLGLNSREYTDFVTFWGPQLHKNKYNFIRFETTAYTKQVPVTVTPAPDCSQRILMVYEGLEEPITIKEQVLKPFTRKGYTLIEWGGMEMPKIVN